MSPTFCDSCGARTFGQAPYPSIARRRAKLVHDRRVCSVYASCTIQIALSEAGWRNLCDAGCFLVGPDCSRVHWAVPLTVTHRDRPEGQPETHVVHGENLM